MCGYINDNGGALVNPGAIGNGEDCRYCQFTETDQFLANLGADYSQRCMAFGVLWVYAAFNIFMAVFLYWLLRVLKKNKRQGTHSCVCMCKCVSGCRLFT